MKLEEFTFDASEFKVQTDKLSVLDSEIANMIDRAIVSHVNNKLESVGQNLYSMFDTRFSRIETHLGMSPIGDDKNASTSNTDKTMGNSAGIPTMLQWVRLSNQQAEQCAILKLYITRRLM